MFSFEHVLYCCVQELTSVDSFTHRYPEDEGYIILISNYFNALEEADTLLIDTVNKKMGYRCLQICYEYVRGDFCSQDSLYVKFRVHKETRFQDMVRICNIIGENYFGYHEKDKVYRHSTINVVFGGMLRNGDGYIKITTSWRATHLSSWNFVFRYSRRSARQIIAIAQNHGYTFDDCKGRFSSKLADIEIIIE